jgi:hypothetical protein
MTSQRVESGKPGSSPGAQQREFRLGGIAPMLRASSRVSLIGLPLAAVMISPGSIPALRDHRFDGLGGNGKADADAAPDGDTMAVFMPMILPSSVLTSSRSNVVACARDEPATVVPQKEAAKRHEEAAGEQDDQATSSVKEKPGDGDAAGHHHAEVEHQTNQPTHLPSRAATSSRSHFVRACLDGLDCCH